MEGLRFLPSHSIRAGLSVVERVGYTGYMDKTFSQYVDEWLAFRDNLSYMSVGVDAFSEAEWVLLDELYMRNVWPILDLRIVEFVAPRIEDIRSGDDENDFTPVVLRSCRSGLVREPVLIRR